MKDAPWWDWGRGCCNKHLGQELPCRVCIETGDFIQLISIYHNGELISQSKDLVEDPWIQYTLSCYDHIVIDYDEGELG